MKLIVTRKIFDDSCTIGTMTVDDVFECYTLEPTTRPDGSPKIFGKTAIPCGTYTVSITFSGHFQRDMPLVNDVPGFSEIRIHPGDVPANTEGCCLVGEHQGKDTILQSIAAFEPLLAKITAAINNGEPVTITYQKGFA